MSTVGAPGTHGAQRTDGATTVSGSGVRPGSDPTTTAAGPVAPPRSERELWERARRLAGRTVAELARDAGIAVPADQRRAKGLVGNLVERALGATGANTDAPDFPDLGVELKTIPVARDGRPRESTFVCTIDLRSIADTDWHGSRARRKLARVLWVPVESEADVPLGQRRLGAPVLWSPARDEEDALRGDWEEIARLIGRGDVEMIDARAGQCLQVRPKARDGRSRGRAADADGAPVRTLPRGFYLRATFTARILHAAFTPGGR